MPSTSALALIAITNSRLLRIDDGQVTFRYRDNRTQKIRLVTLPALDFIGRFLEHVLPRGCTKVRYYGIWSSSCASQLEKAHALLAASPCAIAATSPPALQALPAVLPTPQSRCPHCQTGSLIVVEVLSPRRNHHPP